VPFEYNPSFTNSTVRLPGTGPEFLIFCRTSISAQEKAKNLRETKGRDFLLDSGSD
jgi:hypothetical protein